LNFIHVDIFIKVELVVGETSNCTALVADSFHMLSDVVSQVKISFNLEREKKVISDDFCRLLPWWL